MGKISRMVGVPWHVAKMTREDGDNRRHRSRCTHYAAEPDGHCSYYLGRCRGAAHCDHYEETITEVKINVKNLNNLSKSGISCVKFAGIKNIPMSSIVLDDKFLNSVPDANKIQELKEYVKANGSLDKPIAVSCDGFTYHLKDKFLRYYVAKKLGFKEIPAETGTKEELKNYDKLRTIGTLVWVKKSEEVGQVVGFSLEHTRLRMDSGQEKSFDIHMGLKTEAIRIL